MGDGIDTPAFAQNMDWNSGFCQHLPVIAAAIQSDDMHIEPFSRQMRRQEGQLFFRPRLIQRGNNKDNSQAGRDDVHADN